MTENEFDEDSQIRGDDQLGKKRRGRKRERDDLYFVKAEEKIKEIRVKLKTAKADGLTVKQR